MLDRFEVTDLMNKLSEENEQLNNENKQLRRLLLQFYTEEEIQAEMI